MTRAERWGYHPRMWRCGGRIRWAVGLLLCLATLPVCAQKHERKRLESAEILRLEEAWRQAQMSGDIGAMDRLLSDEFLGVTAAGQVVTKPQQLDRMRARRLQISRLDLSEAKVKISGNLAVVTSLAQLDGISDGTPLRGAYRYTRVYQRLPGDGWKITSFEATRVGGQARINSAVGAPPQASVVAPPVAVPNSNPASPAGSGSPRPPS